jgi:hypothetical protein
VSRVSSIANLPDILLQYRVHGSNVSGGTSPESDQVRLKIRIADWTMLLERGFSSREKDIILQWMKRTPLTAKPDRELLYLMILRVFSAYTEKTGLNRGQREAIRKFTGIRLCDILIVTKKIDAVNIRIFLSALKLNPVYAIGLFGKGIQFIAGKLHSGIRS